MGGSGAPPNKDSQKQISAYLAQVKEALGASNYQRFSVALSSYKKTDNYDAMVCEIVALLTEKPEHYPLMREFHRFVRVHHKKMFNQLCQDITGGIGISKTQTSHPSSEKPSTSGVREPGGGIDRDAPRSTEGPQEGTQREKGPLCPHCDKRGSVPFKCTSCDFYCCKACWIKLLKESGACPACQIPIRKRELEQMFFLAPS